MDWKDKLLFPVIAPLLKAGLWLISKSRLPQVSGSTDLKGLDRPVEVLRDKWGVPHIYASSTKDLLFAQGYVHAQERLWQMDFTRRVVFGRLAEVIGETAVPVDRAFRTVSLYRTAEEEAIRMPGDFCDLLNAYCDGANRWIEYAGDHHKLPVEFFLLGYRPEPWKLADVLGWSKMMDWTLAANWQSEVYRKLLLDKFGPEKLAELDFSSERAWAIILDMGMQLGGGKSTDAAHPYAGPRVGEGVGSNNWVLGGDKTTTGMPLLANDMHLELSTPGIWFENHLHGGVLDVAGVSLPGVPLVIAGHNQNVAWGFTDACPDTQDLFEEHLRKTEAGGWEYEFKGEWLPAQSRKEIMQVKGGGVVQDEVITTHHGPIVNVLFQEAFPDFPPVALKWTALEPDNTVRGIFQMNAARTVAEFHEAMRNFDNPSQNVVYADIYGNIAYTMNGRVPIRARGDGTVPAPGWTGEYEWTGYIPLEDLPHMMNPRKGYVATANNQVEPPGYPYFLGRDYLVSERSGRIVEMIEAQEKIDIAYIQKMHFDQTAISARLLGKALGGLEVEDADLKPIVEQMRSWDGNLCKESWLASVFEATVREAAKTMVDYHLGELGQKARGDGPFSGAWPDHLWGFFIELLDKPDSPWFDLGSGEKRDDVLKAALRRSVDYLKQELGPDMTRWHWGKLHTLTFNHIVGNRKPFERIFSVGPFPIGGDGNTIAASFTSFCNLNHCPVVGPPFRFIADLSDLDHCWGMLAPGQSGNLASPHYKDGVKGWFEGEYHPMLFARAEIEQNLEGRMRLEPKDVDQ